jgi:hypothetical protein
MSLVAARRVLSPQGSLPCPQGAWGPPLRATRRAGSALSSLCSVSDFASASHSLGLEFAPASHSLGSEFALASHSLGSDSLVCVQMNRLEGMCNG